MTPPLKSWAPKAALEGLDAAGRRVAIEPIRDGRRFDELFAAFAADEAGALWRWLPYGPFARREDFRAFAQKTYLAGGIVFHAIVPAASGRAEGVAALMRTDAANGVTEIGHVCLGPSLQKTAAATEAFFLFMAYVFGDLGFRRFEWKCNDGNAGSKRAAERLGFTHEGLFRQHMIVKGENRDTAWFSILDGEWPALKGRFEAWLDPANFDAAGRQRRPLAQRS